MRRLPLFAPMLFLAAAWAAPAQAELQFHEGRWRLELAGASGVHQGSRDRSGDEKAALTLEYAHISNSSLGRRNAGTNTVGVAIGFSF